MKWPTRLARLSRSLYARIVLVYLASLLLLSVATAWIAVSHFNRLSHEFQQRMQVSLASHLALTLHAPLAHGPDSPAARQAARNIAAINPSLSLFLLDAHGAVIADYAEGRCPSSAHVDVAPLQRLLGAHPMLPVYVNAPCSHAPGVFSVARIHYGATQQPGYLLVMLGSPAGMSMTAMLRTSSITRALLAAGIAAILLSALAGLILFALLTRRFSTLTRTVQHFAQGDHGQRMPPGRDDEIGQLARAFNDMAGTIEAQLDALHTSDRERRELVASLSHDFRTPLTSLRGYAEQLRAHAGSTPANRQAVEAILDNTQRLTRLAQQLSLLTRVDAHAHTLRMEPFSLSELASDIASKFAPQAQSADVALRVERASGALMVNADIGLIDRAISNLVDNALHATPPGGSVTLHLGIRDHQVMIDVADTGVGISREDIPLVTQRFYRTASSRRRGEGSGLGLAIVSDICERHDTRLDIRSTLGQGTHMQFVLPLTDAS
ncbi:MAG TPA: HAMP domain-containing sensor histidine kinase [Rhodanobacteraceae bacterium]